MNLTAVLLNNSANGIRILAIIRHETAVGTTYLYTGSLVCQQIPYTQTDKPHCKNSSISTDILWRVFHILTEPVAYTFVSVNRRNNQARVHTAMLASASLSADMRIFFYSAQSTDEHGSLRDNYMRNGVIIGRLRVCVHRNTSVIDSSF